MPDMFESLRSAVRYVAVLLLSFNALLNGFSSAIAQDKDPSARTIRFETTEGTWMDLDVSADGKSIVFSLLGDLYKVAIDGGEATRLTQGMAFDSEPVYSPDG